MRRSVLSEAEIAAVREQVYLIKHDPKALPAHERKVPGAFSCSFLWFSIENGESGPLVVRVFVQK